MSRHSTIPTLYDEVLQISITKLKKWGYLDENGFRSGRITWSRHGIETSSIGILADMRDDFPYIELEYTYNKEEKRKYKIYLDSIPSNLGKGEIWYFVCPSTFKFCRKLYSVGGYFLHREAFKGCFYDSQVQSKYYRFVDKNYGSYFKIDQLYEELYKKNFKKFYAGKPTKRYLKLKAQIEQAESIPYEEIERLYAI